MSAFQRVCATVGQLGKRALGHNQQGATGPVTRKSMGSRSEMRVEKGKNAACP
ncbi:MAG: hypothetical protein JKY66_05095 [Spongiibacteraceae bacterium]|nr:hypothetical protein [Spongiibacteraceae bacterium]